MIRGDGPREPRAEIIDDDGRPRARSVAQAPVPIGQRPARAFGAAAALLAVLGVIVFVGVSNRHPAGPLATPTASAGPPASLGPPFPGAAAGLPVISVDVAQSIAADASRDGEELAVGGFYTAVRLVESCRPSLQPVGTCVSDWQAVLESQPDVRWSSDGVSHPITPGTTAITPVFIAPTSPPAAIQIQSDNPGGPLEVVPPARIVLVGHFHDDRLCAASPGPSTYCTSAFAVDGIADSSGAVTATEGQSQVDSTTRSALGIVAVIRSHIVAGGSVLTYGALPWGTDASQPPYVEPSTDGPPVDGRAVWLVRGYVAGAAGSGTGPPAEALVSWMAIDDVTGQVWGPLSMPAVAAPLRAEFPPTIDGLTVQTVATAVPNGPTSHGVIAVAGYLSNDRAVEGCPPAPTTDKPNPCSGTQLILVDQPGTILVPNDATFLYDFAVPADVPSIRPEILPGTTVDDPWHGLDGIGAETSPWPVVMIGQFGDPRSPECAPRPGGGNAGCDRSFVVDQLAWVGGAEFGPSVFTGSGVRPSHSAPDVSAAVAGWFLPLSQPAIVSMTSTLPADSAALTGVTLEGRPKQLYWVVRVISILPTGPGQLAAGLRRPDARPRRGHLGGLTAPSPAGSAGGSKARSSTISTPGSSRRIAGGAFTFQERLPPPRMISGRSITRRSTQTGRPAGRPKTVTPPSSMPVSSRACSNEANDVRLTPSRPRTVRLTSSRVVARTTQAA